MIMEYLTQDKKDELAIFHNGVIDIVNETKLTPPEVIIVLRSITTYLERVFILSVQGK